MLTYRFDGIDDAVRALASRVEVELALAVAESCEIAAMYAREHHDYQNRTGRLEWTTALQDNSTFRTAGRVGARFGSHMFYASYIEDGTDRIRPRLMFARARDATESERVAIVERRLREAVESAPGWRAT